MANGTLKVSNIQTSSGSGTITIGQSGETLSVPSGATLDMSNATTTLNSSMKNTPAFWSYATGTTSLPNSTGTKITNLTDYVDTNNAFASSRFTVPSGQDGKYVFFGTLSISTNTTILVGFGLNGTTNPGFLGGYDTYHELNSERGSNNSIIFDLVAGDYVELYGYQASGGSVNANAGRTRFYGYKLIGA